MQGFFLIDTTSNFMGTAYVHTSKTKAKMMITDLTWGGGPQIQDWVELFRTAGLRSGELVSEHKQNTKPDNISMEQNNGFTHHFQ